MEADKAVQQKPVVLMVAAEFKIQTLKDKIQALKDENTAMVKNLAVVTTQLSFAQQQLARAADENEALKLKKDSMKKSHVEEMMELGAAIQNSFQEKLAARLDSSQ